MSLIGLPRGLDEVNVNRGMLRAVPEKAQDKLVDELCGRKYSRSGGKRFRRT